MTNTPQVQSCGTAGWLPVGTTISTISLRRLAEEPF
jgi:hypothetical protein